MIVKNYKSPHKMSFLFLVSGWALQYKQERNNEWGSTLVYCIFTILVKDMKPKKGYFSLST